MRLSPANGWDKKPPDLAKKSKCKDSILKQSSSAPASPAEYAKQSHTTAHHLHHTVSTEDHKASGIRRPQKPSRFPQKRQDDPA